MNRAHSITTRRAGPATPRADHGEGPISGVAFAVRPRYALRLLKPSVARYETGGHPGTQAVRRAVSLLKAFTAEQPAARPGGPGPRGPTAQDDRLPPAAGAGGGRAGGAHGRRRGLPAGPGAADAGRPGSGRAARCARPRVRSCRRWRGARARPRRWRCWWAASALMLDEEMGGYVIGARPWSARAGRRMRASTGQGPAWRTCRRSAGGRCCGRAWPGLTPRTRDGRGPGPRAGARGEQGFATAIEELEPGYVAVAARPCATRPARWWPRSAWAGRRHGWGRTAWTPARSR